MTAEELAKYKRPTRVGCKEVIQRIRIRQLALSTLRKMLTKGQAD